MQYYLDNKKLFYANSKIHDYCSKVSLREVVLSKLLQGCIDQLKPDEEDIVIRSFHMLAIPLFKRDRRVQ